MSNTELTLDIATLWRIFKKHAAVVIAFTLIATAVGYVVASFIVPKKYSASAMFYVENRSQQTQTETINSAEISAARSVISTAINIFMTGDVMARLIERTGLPYSSGAMLGMVSMSALGNTETMTITTTMDDPQVALDTLAVLSEVCIERYQEIIGAGKMLMTDSPSGGGVVFPNVNMFTMVGFLIGFLGSYLVVFVIEILDTKVKAEDDLFKIYNIPVFAEIMNFDVRVKGDYGYEYK